MRRILSVATVLAAAVPLGLWKSVPPGAEDSGMDISRDDSRPETQGPAETFTGEVSVKPLFDTNDARDFSSAQVSFTPCARTAWHTHPGGQTLIVTSGTGWVQEWGGQKKDIKAGDVIWTQPAVKHWHGATTDAAMTHIAIQAATSKSNRGPTRRSSNPPMRSFACRRRVSAVAIYGHGVDSTTSPSRHRWATNTWASSKRSAATSR
jgi:quercetin dioxygenase-like cupin family protein